jgi:hypothetical protein
MFYFNKATGEKSWITLLRVEEVEEETSKEEEQPARRAKLIGKQPPTKPYLKTMNAEADKNEKDRKMKDLTFRVPKSLDEGGRMQRLTMTMSKVKTNEGARRSQRCLQKLKTRIKSMT